MAYSCSFNIPDANEVENELRHTAVMGGRPITTGRQSSDQRVRRFIAIVLQSFVMRASHAVLTRVP